jgi:hypothetical protein
MGTLCRLENGHGTRVTSYVILKKQFIEWFILDVLRGLCMFPECLMLIMYSVMPLDQMDKNGVSQSTWTLR